MFLIIFTDVKYANIQTLEYLKTLLYYGGMYQELFAIQEDIFRTIASQKRLELIQLLHTRELTVSDITEMLDIRQSNVSQHLSELRKAKIVSTRKDGTSVYYRLSDPRIAHACELIKSFLQDQHNINPEMKKMMDDDAHMYPVVVDPVCKMRVSIAYAGGSEEHDHRIYYFCASGCHTKFVANPKKYIKEERSA